MLRRIAALLLILVTVGLSGCAATATSGLSRYASASQGYEFFYPTGWLPVQVTNGPDVVFHDLIETTENVSVVVSPVPQGKTLEELGSPGEVGYQLAKNALAPAGSNRKAELVDAQARQVGEQTYYLLEYQIRLPNQPDRHNLANVAVSRGKLYTFNASTTEARWPKVKGLLQQVTASFSVS